MTSSRESSESDRPYSGTWFHRIITRATELLVLEDARLKGIVFRIVRADENEIILAPEGSPSSVEKLPRPPAVFRTFIRRAVDEHGPDLVREDIAADRHWPLLGYASDDAGSPEARRPPPGVISGDDSTYRRDVGAYLSREEAASQVRALISSPTGPREETRVDTSEEPEASPGDEGRRVDRRVEAIEHPSHYNLGGIEVWDATDEWGLGKGFNRGSVIKYVVRAGDKPGSDELEDLKKAAAFLQHEIERVERERG